MKLGKAGEAFFLERTRVITTRGESNSLRGKKQKATNNQAYTPTSEKGDKANNISFDSMK